MSTTTTPPTEEQRMALVHELSGYILHMALHFAKAFNQDHRELEHVGTIKAFHLAALFDPTRGVKFYSYAFRSVRVEIRNAAIDISKQVSGYREDYFRATTFSLDKPLGEREREALGSVFCGNPEEVTDAVDAPMRDTLLASALHNLPPREQHVIKARYFDDLTFEEIAPQLGVTRQRIQQIEKDALLRLRFQPAIQQIAA